MFEALRDSIELKLLALADPERREKAKTLYPTKLEVIGVKVPDMRIISKDTSKHFKKESGETVIGFIQELSQNRYFEVVHLAYEVLARHKSAMALMDSSKLKAIENGLDNWVLVDTYASMISGVLLRENRLSMDEILGWAVDDDRWRRRIAIVLTIALNQKARGGKGDPLRTIEICETAIDDRDEFVVKALSWALRELSKRDKQIIADFIAKYESRLSNKVLREVRTKIIFGTKNKKGDSKL